MKKIISLAIVFVVAFSTFSVLITNSGSEIDNEYWRRITIDNSGNSETLSDYQVFLNVTYDSDMQPDFDDLRFTWYNETSGQEVNIDYWLDKYVDSEYALVWVEVPSIRGLGQEVLYMYYGDLDAISASNGEETFVFFDDFSTDTTSNYEFVKETLYPWADGIIAWNSAEGLLELTDNDPDEIARGRGSYVWVRQKNELIDVSEDNYWVETRGKISGTPTPDMFNVIHFYDYTGDHSTANGYYRLQASLRAYKIFQITNRWGQGVWEFYDTVPTDWHKDTWYRWSLCTISNGSVYARLYDDTYGLSAVLDNVTAHQDVDWWVGLGHGAGGSYGLTSSYDYARVRKFTDPEPSYSIGPEEPLSATVDIDPDTLNLKSNGEWITAYVTLPEGYSVGDIDIASVELIHNDVVVDTADWGEVQDGVLMAKFDRATLRDYLGEVDVDDGDKFYDITLTVTGNVAGTLFEGSDTITVKRR